jgi:trigger factor
MTTTLNEISNCKRELQITITKDEFNHAYNDNVKKIQQNIKMPGFRPGKVPANLITQQYGPSVKAETMEELANSNLKEFLDNSKVKAVGHPTFMDAKENEDGSQTFIVEFEVIPDFDLKDYSSLEIYEPVYRVTDEEVEKEIEFQARRFGNSEVIDIVSDFDVVVTVDSHLIDPETKTVIETEQPLTDVVIDFSIEASEELKKILLNAKVGDEIEHFPKNKEGQNLRPEKIVVKKIEKITPCDIDDEFAKLASGGRFDSIEDFRQEVGFQIQKHWDDRAKQLMEEQVFTKIVELHNDFELPTVMVETTKKILSDSLLKQNPKANLDDIEMQNHIEAAANRSVRSDIVRSRIIEKEDLKVEDFDYENFIDDFLMRRPDFAQNVSKEAMISQIKGDERLTNQILQQKYVDFLMDFAKTNEISFEDFAKQQAIA